MTRLTWFLPLRLATYMVLFVVVVLRLGYPSHMQIPFIVYSVFTLAFAVVLAVGNRGRGRALTALAVGFQYCLEIVVEAAVVHATGDISSPYSALFLLTIVSAAMSYRLVGTLLVASMVSLSFSFIMWLRLAMGDNPDFAGAPLNGLLSVQDQVFYSIFLHILIFYLVAFVSGYLAERLQQRDRALADASRALRKARLETDDILRHLNSGLLTIDSAGRIIYFNRAAERILGYHEEDVKGMRCDDVFGERMPELAGCLRDGLSLGVEHPRREFNILTAERASLPLGLSTSILTEEDGELRGVIGIFSDLTQAKVLEAKVRAADRLAAVGELSAAIAHEIRNPLAAISGSVEVLKNELDLEGENGRLMELIVKESHRLSKVLSEFLLYAKIDRVYYNKVELCHLTSEVLQLARHHPSRREGTEIRFEADDSLVYVVGDGDLIKQLLLNLVVNACEAVEGDYGEITVRLVVTPGRERAELYVQDNGAGITPADLKKIYQPFYSTKKHGTGLGLSIVHRVCTALELDVSVDSQPGEGTTFMIEFLLYQTAGTTAGSADIEIVTDDVAVT